MPRLPDLEAMAIFATVAQAHGITAAAKSLGLSAPTVSKALARLEQRVGTPLFHRTSRRLMLTDAGRNLAARAGRILADAEEAEAALLEQSAAPRGQVRLTAPMSFGIRTVAPLLPDFLTAYPDITVDLHLSDATTDLIAEGFDAALRIGILPNSSLKARQLASVQRIAVAAPSYLARHGRPNHPSDLHHHRCFAYAYMQPRDAWCFTHRATGQMVSARASGPLRVNNGEALLPALVTGLGIAELPDFLVQDALASGTLESILPDWMLPQAGLYLLTPPTPPQPARVQALTAFLVRALGKKGGEGARA